MKNTTMKHPFLVGNNIYLRGLEKEDLSGSYFDWLNDYEVTKYLDSGMFPNNIKKMQEYYESVTSNPNSVMFAIIEKASDEHIGNIKLGSINWIARTADIGILIGQKEAWGKGFGTEAIELVRDYAFKRLNINKLIAGIIVENTGSLKAFKKAGFEVEGCLRSRAFVDGKYCDSWYMSLIL